MGAKLALAGCEIEMVAGKSDVDIRMKMGLSALGPLEMFPFKSGAPNQKAVSVCDKAFVAGKRKNKR